MDENEGYSNREADSVDFVICARRLSKYLERNLFGRFKGRSTRIYNSKGIMVDLKREFSGGDNETMKIAELKKLKQENKTKEEFVQKFRRAAKESEYKKKPLVEEFKI